MSPVPARLKRAAGASSDLVPDAHDPSVRHAPMMLTTDLALKDDPAYREITLRWLDDPDEFEDAFALAPQAAFLNLTIPEMTVLVGGMRAMGGNAGGSPHGGFTDRPGTLSNDFFVNLIDMSTQWSESSTEGVYEGRDRVTGHLKWTATPVDLIFGSNSELRAVAEHYAANDGQDAFLEDFIEAWAKVMTLDRFDLQR